MQSRFRTLIDHFFGRFFDKESLSADADERANVVQIIAILALPGAIISLFMMVDHPLIQSELVRLWLRAGDRFGLVCYSMAVMGFVMTFKWDSLFPDRRDYLILTPLPISLREFFGARAISLCGFLLLFAVAINFFSCFMVPYAYVIRDNQLSMYPPAFLAHATAVLSASAFTAMCFAALQGVLINIMNPAMFRKASHWIQMIAMTILVTMLLLTPGLSMNIQVLIESRTPALNYIPLFWFLGIYEVLNPEGTLIPAADDWALMALKAMFAVSVLFLLTYLISYRRYSKKVLEGIESNRFEEPFYQRALAAGLNRVLLRHPFRRASYYFIGRIFARSSKHRLFMAMYSGIGLALTLSSLLVLKRSTSFFISISPNGLVEAPLILSFFVVSGLRATFNIPYELGANWMFQITSGRRASEFFKATRRWVMLRGVIPAYVVLVPIEFGSLPPREAIFHLAFGLAMAALLIEGLFFSFNKVPFTCSYLPAKSHLAFLGGAYLYGFTIYAFTVGSFETWVWESPLRVTAFFASVAAILSCVAVYRRQSLDHTLDVIYEDSGEPLVRQLNLT